MTIEEAIYQTKFTDEYEKVDINLMYTTNWMNAQKHQHIKEFDISWQQFNILRILRGQKGKPAPLKLITERMLDKMSNTSRLVEKMVKKQLLERNQCPDNRRQVDISLTKKGLQVCNKVSDIIVKVRIDNLRITKKEAMELNRILNKIRS